MKGSEKMSESSLWTIDHDYRGEEYATFENAWLLPPIALDILFEKYLPEEAVSEYGKKQYLIALWRDRNLFSRLNNKVNESPVQTDRVLWEFCHSQIFFAKDKNFIACSLREFLQENAGFTKEFVTDLFERFQEVANEISQLDETMYPYFVFKNTSVDDNVAFWFRYFDDEQQVYCSRTLRDVDCPVSEFVLIENDKIIGFVSNKEFFQKQDDLTK